jgi:hypothetical protein
MTGSPLFSLNEVRVVLKAGDEESMFGNAWMMQKIQEFGQLLKYSMC